MTATRCRWDREHGEYLTPDGDTCDLPKRDHCTARRNCSNHPAWGEQTCARCLHQTRTSIRQIATRSALMLPEAIINGVDSEAANLAGPACDAEAWSWRKVAAMQGRAWHVSQDEDDDDWHPFTVLTRWAWMVAGAYRLPEPDVWTIANAAELLDRQLHRIANDKCQDFRQLASEVKACRNHIELVLHNSDTPERGAPCPSCKDAGKFVRLVREYSHYCDNPDCHQFHLLTDEGDVWRCPVKAEHWWNPQGYADMLKERAG